MQKKSSLSLIPAFLLIVFSLAFLSVSYKVFLLVKNSSFSYKTFNFMLLNHDAYLVHLDRGENKAIIIKFPNKGELLINRSFLSSSILIGLPINGIIIATADRESENLFKDGLVDFNEVIKIIFSGGNFTLQGMNQFDVIKIYLAMEKIPRNDLAVETIDDFGTDFRNNTYPLLSSDIFRDQEIFNDKITIEIINSTGIDGLGVRVADILKTVGYNVISIKTGNDKKSKIISRTDDISQKKRLAEVLGLKSEKSTGQSIADVSVILGEDIKKSLD